MTLSLVETLVLFATLYSGPELSSNISPIFMVIDRMYFFVLVVLAAEIARSVTGCAMTDVIAAV